MAARTKHFHDNKCRVHGVNSQIALARRRVKPVGRVTPCAPIL
jgi:hypothetical protein